MKFYTILAAVFFFSAPAYGEVDLSKSSFIWKGSKITGDFHTGPIKMKAATLKDGKGTFVADLNTIEDTTLTGKWNQKFISHIKSDDFFDVEKFPEAKLVLSKMENGIAHGKLTIKEKTNSVKIPYKKSGNTYTGTLTFDRTKYGVIYGSKNFFKNLGDKVISDEVTLTFKVVTK